MPPGSSQRERTNGARKLAERGAWRLAGEDRRLNLSSAGFSLGLVVILFAAPLITPSQSGRQKPPTSPSNNNSRPRQVSKKESSPTPRKAQNSEPFQDSPRPVDDSPDVVRVSSHLVPVPTTVLDQRGLAVSNLKLEDFELTVDGRITPISDISRSESPVRMAMLFDNSGSLMESREFEKHAATRFFSNVMRPMDQAAVYSVSTDVILSQPLTSDVALLRQTIEGFGKPDGATSLYYAMFAAATYLKPYQGRRVIVIVSDGRDTTSRTAHDFDATLQRVLADDCQIYVVQTGIYDNANVRDLAAERRMEEFSAQTGGAAYIPKTVSDLDTAFSQIAADLAQQYILSYYPGADKRDGRFHLISVRVKTRPNTRVRARKGFMVKVRDRT